MEDSRAEENVADQRQRRNYAPTTTLLIVEDDTPLRRLLCKVVTDASYRILEATNGQEALHLALDYSNPIDLLLTDVNMPGMNGGELMDRLRADRPNLTVLFMSGYDHRLLGDRLRDPGVAFLPKPFTPKTLLRSIDELMAEPGRLGPERFAASA